MKQNAKKWVLLVMALAIVASASACGIKRTQPKKAAAEPAAAQTTPEPAPSEPEPEVPEVPEEPAEPAEAEAPEEPAEPAEAEAPEAAPIDGIRPEFKEAMDSYEAFYTKYCDFMVSYNENPTDLSLLADYTSMLSQMEEMNQKFDAWEDEDLSDEELKYYLEVNTRIEKMLVDAM